jgi:tripartite-type tricarboxylate transporter receptor subunit TctC
LGKSSESRKGRVESRPIESRNGRDRRAARKVNATELARRRFLHLAVGSAALPATPRLAWAQAYPTHPITMIVPYPAGAPMDVIGRLIGERMRGTLGRPVIIENVSGADGSIGTGRAARSRPDGYTIDLGSLGTHVLNGAYYSLQYDPLSDFVPVTPLVTSAFVLFARQTMAAKDLHELIGWLMANPNRASAAITNVGIRALAGFFQKQTGTQFTLVPYRGLPAAAQDLAAGEVDLLFGTPDQLPLMRAGNIKAYAVTSSTRLAMAPEIPTFAEMRLPALSYYEWVALFAPKGTPRDIIGKLHAAAVEALADPATKSRLVELGFGVFPRENQTPEALGAQMKADAEKWWPVIKGLGIKAE